MEKEKIIILVEIWNLKENIQMEKDGIAKAVKEYRQAIDEMKGC